MNSVRPPKREQSITPYCIGRRHLAALRFGNNGGEDVMRLWGLFIACGCCLNAPALANTYIATLSFSGSPSSGGDTVYGPVFNPALGTLAGVTMTADGSYTPHIFIGPAVSSHTAVLDVALVTYGAGGGSTTISAGSERLTYGGGFLNGSAENFSETATVSNASALSQVYTAFGPYTSGGLLGLDVYSKPVMSGAWGSAADDLSSYTGTLTVAFTYVPATKVPEPASLALLGFGCATTIAFGRRRRVLVLPFA